jgi:hypothetical protein
MDNFLKFSTSDRQAFFTEAEARSGINATVLEKDFWVCWTLKQLFNNQELFDNMIFKGGTSLSKSYGLIDRFSEDCDLTINRLVLNVQNPSGLTYADATEPIKHLKPPPSMCKMCTY